MVLSLLRHHFTKFDKRDKKMTGLLGEWQWESNTDDTESNRPCLWEEREAELLPAMHIECGKLTAWLSHSAPLLEESIV